MKSFIFIFIFGLHLLAHAEPVIGLKNFRSLYFSMVSVTGVKPTPEINKRYKEIMTRLPKDGRVDEFSSLMAMAAKDIAGLFCIEFTKAYSVPADLNAMLSDLSNRFYQRALSEKEAKLLTVLVKSLNPETNRVFMACTVMLSSVEFLVQK